MKADVIKALDVEREKNQRNMVDGVNNIMRSFKKVEKAVETFKKAPNKDYSIIEDALKEYKMTLENIK